MAKIVMTLLIPDPKIRKPRTKAVQKHKDKSKYTRKTKHKAPEWGPFCCRESARRAAAPRQGQAKANFFQSISPVKCSGGHKSERPPRRPTQRAAQRAEPVRRTCGPSGNREQCVVVQRKTKFFS